MGQLRTGMFSTGLGRVQSERCNVVKKSFALGASAVAGCFTLVALKMLTRGSGD